MANEFIIKNGFHSKGDSQITGSLTSDNLITTHVTASGNISSSGTIVASNLSGTNTGDQDLSSFITNSQTASMSVESASFAVTASHLLNNPPPFPFTGDAVITGSLVVSGSFIPHGTGTTTNIIIGKNAAPNITSTSDNNVLIGNEAGGTGTLSNADSNVCIGYQAGYEIDGGDDNIAIGNQAGYLMDGPTGTIAIGSQAMRNAENNYGVGIGYQAGRLQENNPNIFIGGLAAGSVAGVSRYNIAIGYQSAYSINDGYYNTILGNKAGYSINDGYSNIFIGRSAGYNVTDGDGNIIIGSGSLAEAGTTNQLRIGNSDTIVISASLATGDVIFASTASAAYFVGNGSALTNLQRPITSSGVNFSASVDNAGYYFRTGGNVTCSIGTSDATGIAVGTEYEFFQTASAGTLCFATSSGVTLNSKSGNKNLAGKFSAATLKKVATDTYDLIGDLD